VRAVVQRVTRGAVRVDGELLGAIGRGLVVLLGVKDGDGQMEADWLARKVANLRIFEDEQGKSNRSLLDVAGEALVVSQFTLYGDARRGNRPSFSAAAVPEVAAPLVEYFGVALERCGVSHVASGRFRAHMLVEILNDGPLTIVLDTETTRRGNTRE
jgi:D-aminoacyl-tRNA deacylase